MYTKQIPQECRCGRIEGWDGTAIDNMNLRQSPVWNMNERVVPYRAFVSFIRNQLLCNTARKRTLYFGVWEADRINYSLSGF